MGSVPFNGFQAVYIVGVTRLSWVTDGNVGSLSPLPADDTGNVGSLSPLSDGCSRECGQFIPLADGCHRECGQFISSGTGLLTLELG